MLKGLLNPIKALKSMGAGSACNAPAPKRCHEHRRTQVLYKDTPRGNARRFMRIGASPVLVAMKLPWGSRHNPTFAGKRTIHKRLADVIG